MNFKQLYRFIALICGLLFGSGLAQDVMPPTDFTTAIPQAGENVSIAIRWVANEYINPETERIDRNYLGFESFDEVAGEDVRVEIWGLPTDGANIWIFVHDRTADKWWSYGGANHEGNGIWVIHGVRFGEGAHQGQRFTIRAAIMDEPPAQRLIDGESWTRSAIAISDPIYTTIQRRLVRPYPPTGDVRSPQIWLSTIDHLTVSSTEAMVVPPTTGIAGTFEMPGQTSMANSAQDETEKEFIYVMIRSTASDRWRIFGPAVKNGVKWEIRDVDISDPGEPQWVKFKISAVMSRVRLPEGYVDYEDWWEHKITASDPVEVSVKAHTPNINRPYPQIDVSFIQTLADTQAVYSDEPLTLDSLGEMIQVGGHINNIPQGASVWLLINPIGTPLWEVHGKAIVTPPYWELPLIHSNRLKLLNADQFRMQAVVSTSTLQPGLIEYDTWRMNTLSISDGVVINENIPEKKHRYRFDDIVIDRIGGQDTREDLTVANLMYNSRVEGTISRLPQGTTLWVGTRRSGFDDWHFTGPAFLNEERWVIPNTFFAGLVTSEENPQDKYFDVVAVATKGGLPVTTLKSDELQWYALGTSPVARLSHQEGFSFQFASLGNSPTIFLILLLLAILVFLEYYFRTVTEVSRYLADIFTELTEYLQTQFKDIPKPEVIPSTFGMIILVLGVFAIVGYFPIYTHVLEEVLNLSPDKSESLALLLIIFIGLAGVITHLSIEYVSDRGGKFINRIFDYFLNYALPISVLLVTFCLWGVQALLYLELYTNQVEAGNVRIPAAMGAAAFFIAGIETLGFYWAARLGMDFLGWLSYNLFILGPPALLAKIFGVIHTFFNGLHNRESETDEAPPKRKYSIPARQRG